MNGSEKIPEMYLIKYVSTSHVVKALLSSKVSQAQRCQGQLSPPSSNSPHQLASSERMYVLYRLD